LKGTVEMKVYPMLLDGELVDKGKAFSVYDPSNGNVVGEAIEAEKSQVEEAVEAAKKALYSWSDLSIQERAKALLSASDIIEANKEELSKLYTLEQGKPISDARIEVSRVIDYFRSYAEMAPLIREELANVTETAISYFSWMPVGVVGIIIPWNSPLVLGAIKAPPALLAGNTIILKPPSYVPLSWLKIAELIKDIFPPGVFNIITGSGSNVGETIVAHPDVAMISFTGDSETGKRIMEAASPTLKKLTLELGGNDPAIFLHDAPLDDEHLNRIINACFRNAGQLCMAVKRIYVEHSIMDEFLKWFVEGVKKIKVGPGLKDSVDMGPLNNKPQLEFVEELVEEARGSGAKILIGGSRPEGEDFKKGFFYLPTVIYTENESLKIVYEEQFGPVVPVIPFDNEEDAIKKANNTRYGLGGSVWSKNIGKALSLAKKIESGVTWVNGHSVRYLGPMACYGGVKDSGLGREKGIYGLQEYLERKTISLIL